MISVNDFEKFIKKLHIKIINTKKGKLPLTVHEALKLSRITRYKILKDLEDKDEIIYFPDKNFNCPCGFHFAIKATV